MMKEQQLRLEEDLSEKLKVICKLLEKIPVNIPIVDHQSAAAENHGHKERTSMSAVLLQCYNFFVHSDCRNVQPYLIAVQVVTSQNVAHLHL